MRNTVDTMEERFKQLRTLDGQEAEACLKDGTMLSDFIRQEISLALQKRNEELVFEVREIQYLNEVSRRPLSASFILEKVIELLKQP